MSLLERTIEQGRPSGAGQPNRAQDFYAWFLDQAQKLRVHQAELVGWPALAEELEKMALRTRHELLSHLEELLVHLLKLQYEPSENTRRRNERQWKIHLTEYRNRLNDLLDDSRALRNMFDDFKRKAYPRACKKAQLAIGERFHGPFPAQPPCTDEQILNDEFFPSQLRGHKLNAVCQAFISIAAKLGEKLRPTRRRSSEHILRGHSSCGF